jgi:hypothetical protein
MCEYVGALADVAQADYRTAPEQKEASKSNQRIHVQVAEGLAGVVINLPWNAGDKRSGKNLKSNGQTTSKQRTNQKVGAGNGTNYRRGAIWDAGSNERMGGGGGHSNLSKTRGYTR